MGVTSEVTFSCYDAAVNMFTIVTACMVRARSMEAQANTLFLRKTGKHEWIWFWYGCIVLPKTQKLINITDFLGNSILVLTNVCFGCIKLHYKVKVNKITDY